VNWFTRERKEEQPRERVQKSTICAKDGQEADDDETVAASQHLVTRPSLPVTQSPLVKSTRALDSRGRFHIRKQTPLLVNLPSVYSVVE
jgi:hypothetical protein